jgi:hypothetical protein
VTAADWPREDRAAERLLWVDAVTGRLEDRRVADLARLLRAGDLLVVNDAATLPASLTGTTEAGEPVELRLAGGGPCCSVPAIGVSAPRCGPRRRLSSAAPDCVSTRASRRA